MYMVKWMMLLLLLLLSLCGDCHKSVHFELAYPSCTYSTCRLCYLCGRKGTGTLYILYGTLYYEQESYEVSYKMLHRREEERGGGKIRREDFLWLIDPYQMPAARAQG